MSEPLLAALACARRALTVAALPWVAPVYRAMPQVAEVIELRSRTAASTGRRDAASRRAAWPLRRRLRAAEFDQGGAAALARRHPAPHRLPRRRPLAAAEPAPAESAGSPADGRLLRRAGRRRRCRPTRPRGSASTRRRSTRATAAVDVRPGAYWAFAPGAEYGPAKRWPPARYAELARSLHAEERLCRSLLLGSAGEAPLCDEIAAAAPGACRVLAGKVSLLDAMALIAARARHRQQRFGPDARGRGVRRAASGGVRLDQPDAHAAAERARAGRLAEGRAAARLHAVLRPHLPFGHTRCLVEVSAARVEAALRSALGCAG